MIYENIENIKPENHHRLLEDLVARTGLDIYRFEIDTIDFLKDIAHIRVFYNEKSTRETAIIKQSDLVSSGSSTKTLSKEGQ